MIKFLKFCFIAIYQSIFFVLDKLIREEKGLITFYVTDKTLGDNLYYFYNHLKDKDLEPLLIIQHKSLFNTIKNEKVVYVKSFKGFLTYFKSQCIVIQNGDAKLFFFPLLLNPKTKFILNLWHGIPLKKLNRQVKQYQKNRSFFQYQSYSALTVCSEFERLLMASCFYMDLDHIWVTGTPRNDELLAPLGRNKELENLKDKNVILYAPTWREFGNKCSFFPFEDYNEQELIDFLEHNDTYLLLRGHRLEMELLDRSFGNLAQKSTRIILAGQEKFPNIPDLLKITSVLVTDYSSIYLDFLLLNRPIIFIPYDLKEYQSYRGFLFDYESHTPGDKVFTQKDFFTSIKKGLLESNSDIRMNEMNVMHKYKDNLSKERIYTELSAKLNVNQN